MIFDSEPSTRRDFSITTKRIEWMDAAGKDVMQYIRDKKFVKTSYCRRCKRKMTWGDRTYNFDHKDNNPRNNSQKNCYLVCRICHGKATKIEKRAIRGIFGEIEGYETIKRKVGYKRPRKTKTTKKKIAKKVTAKSSKKKSTTGTRKRTSR